MGNERHSITITIDSLDSVSIEQPDAAFSKALIEYTGIHRYCAIMRFEGDVTDIGSGFQRLFNGYYNVRRPEEWRRNYYALFQKIRKQANPGYEQIIAELCDRTGRVEPSFASKILASVNPVMPIWDRRVVAALKRYDAALPVMSTASVGGCIEKAIAGYDALCKVCQELLNRPIGKLCIDRFDKWLCDYSDVSNMKKLDVVLWCAGD